MRKNESTLGILAEEWILFPVYTPFPLLHKGPSHSPATLPIVVEVLLPHSQELILSNERRKERERTGEGERCLFFHCLYKVLASRMGCVGCFYTWLTSGLKVLSVRFAVLEVRRMASSSSVILPIIQSNEWIGMNWIGMNEQRIKGLTMG